MDSKGPALAIGSVGWRVMQGLTVVEHDAAGRELDNDCLVLVHGGADVEKGRGRFRSVVVHGHSVRSGDDVHSAIGDVYVIEREPATDEVGRDTLPVGVVLVPEDRFALLGRLEQSLIVEELDIRSDQAFRDVEDAVVIQQPSIQKTPFAHLHNLKHLAIGIALFRDVIGVVDGQVSISSVFKSLGKETVIFVTQPVNQLVVQQFADRETALVEERSYLLS